MIFVNMVFPLSRSMSAAGIKGVSAFPTTSAKKTVVPPLASGRRKQGRVVLSGFYRNFDERSVSAPCHGIDSVVVDKRHVDVNAFFRHPTRFPNPAGFPNYPDIGVFP